MTIVKRLISASRISAESFMDLSRLVLFCLTPREMPTLTIRTDVEIKRMTSEDLASLTHGCGRFADQARKYYSQRGIDTAYGAYMGSELIHMSWVYTASEYAREPFERLALKDREVEIVNCFTLETCRGLGIFPYVIKFLAEIQFQNGADRIYMMAHYHNQASRHGIIKAGLRSVGSVTYVRIPASSSKSIYYRRSQSSEIST